MPQIHSLLSRYDWSGKRNEGKFFSLVDEDGLLETEHVEVISTRYWRDRTCRPMTKRSKYDDAFMKYCLNASPAANSYPLTWSAQM